MAPMTGGPSPVRRVVDRGAVADAFAASARLAAERGVRLETALDDPAFQTLAGIAGPDGPAGIEPVARLVENRLGVLRTALPWGADLLAYEGARFRAALAGDPGAPGRGPARAPSAQVLDLDWDVTGLAEAARRGDATLPAPARGPVRVLVVRTPAGAVQAVPCPDDLLVLLARLDGEQPAVALAAHLGRPEGDVRQDLARLAALGAVTQAGSP